MKQFIGYSNAFYYSDKFNISNVLRSIPFRVIKFKYV